jgi:hypothetical protein
MSDFPLSLSRYLQLFDVDRLKLEAAYSKNALFSCRIHHVQEPSFSMAGLFAPESSRRRQGFNVSRELKNCLFILFFFDDYHTSLPCINISH